VFHPRIPPISRRFSRMTDDGAVRERESFPPRTAGPASVTRAEPCRRGSGYVAGGSGNVTTWSTRACARTRVPVVSIDDEGCEECTRRPEGSRMQ
jgi:hypothetical protein